MKETTATPPAGEPVGNYEPARDMFEGGFRWWPAALIFVLAGAAFSVLVFRGDVAFDGDGTQLVFVGLGVGAGTIAALLVWWLAFSRLSWRVKGIGLLGFALVGGGAAAAVRIEQVDGAMRPTKISWRWEPSSEERILQALATRQSSAGDTTWTAPEAPTELDWPRFRGASADGVVPDGTVRLDWDDDRPDEVWRQPVGLGWSSFAVVGGRAFTQEQRGEEELVVCYDAETGKQIWTHSVPTRFTEPVGGDGPRATPTYAEGRLYAVGANGNLAALDPVDGSPVWERDVLEDAADGGGRLENNPWAVAASPFVEDGRLFIPAGNEVTGAAIAYDTATGEPLWVTGDDPASYATITSAEFEGVRHLLLYDGLGLNGLDPETGRRLWHVDWTNQPKVNAMIPVVRRNRIFVSSGYGVGSGLFAVESVGEAWAVGRVWATPNRFKLKFNDPVVVDGHIYGLDEGILACVEFATGERKWKRGRFGYGQLLLVEEDRLLVLGEDGVVTLVAATSEGYDKLASFRAIEGKTWNHPAIADGLLFVRNSEEAACYNLRPALARIAAVK